MKKWQKSPPTNPIKESEKIQRTDPTKISTPYMHGILPTHSKRKSKSQRLLPSKFSIASNFWTIKWLRCSYLAHLTTFKMFSFWSSHYFEKSKNKHSSYLSNFRFVPTNRKFSSELQMYATILYLYNYSYMTIPVAYDSVISTRY